MRSKTGLRALVVTAVSSAMVLSTATPSGALATAAGSPARRFTNPTLQQTDIARTCEPYKTSPSYPSAVTVSGLTGTITDVNVVLNDFAAADRDPGTAGTLGFSEDADILLQAPNGTNLMVMSDVGSGNVSGLDVKIDDSAPTALPADTPLPSNTAITGKPTDDDNDSTVEEPEPVPIDRFTNDLSCVPDPLGDPTDTYTFSGPSPSANTTLSVFNGINPNGTWNLWMVDDFGGPEVVALDAGWSLVITAGPPARPAVYRPATNYWFFNGGPTVQFGTAGDIPVPGDYDGNATVDVAVFRPSNGYWFVNGGPIVQFGSNGDIPVPGDYNGNGTMDMAVFRPSTGYWFINGGPIVQFGASSDIPVPGDYDGNGTTDIAVYRPSNGYWFVNGGPVVQFGAPGDIPVPGDYDGDGDTDIAVYRPSNGYWFVLGGPIVQFGAPGDIPAPGDYDGNGTTDFAVFRPSNGYWFVHGGGITQFGASGDRPLPLPTAIRQVFFP